MGIPDDVIGRIFDPFFTTKEDGKGSGLGLSMVFGFIKQSGGHITVRTRVGSGTTFSLYLPQCLRQSEHEPSANAPHYHSDATGRLETLLIVEDNARLRRVTAVQLIKLGYRVIEAENAIAARTVLQTAEPVSLLFTDVVMPGDMNGIELVEWAIGTRPDLRCLLTSGYSDPDGFEQRLKSLNCKLLSKPFRRGALAHAIREALETDVPV